MAALHIYLRGDKGNEDSELWCRDAEHCTGADFVRADPGQDCEIGRAHV